MQERYDEDFKNLKDQLVINVESNEDVVFLRVEVVNEQFIKIIRIFEVDLEMVF